MACSCYDGWRRNSQGLLWMMESLNLPASIPGSLHLLDVARHTWIEDPIRDCEQFPEPLARSYTLPVGCEGTVQPKADASLSAHAMPTRGARSALSPAAREEFDRMVSPRGLRARARLHTVCLVLKDSRNLRNTVCAVLFGGDSRMSSRLESATEDRTSKIRGRLYPDGVPQSIVSSMRSQDDEDS